MQHTVLYSPTKLIAICKGGFLILDISSLTSIQIIADKSNFNPTNNHQKASLTPDKKYLLMPQKDGTAKGVHIINLIDLTNPTELTLLKEENAWRAITHPDITKKYLFVLNVWDKLICYDYTYWYNLPTPPATPDPLLLQK